MAKQPYWHPLSHCGGWLVVYWSKLGRSSRSLLPMYDLCFQGLQLMCNLLGFFSTINLCKQQAAKIMSVTLSGDSLIVVKNTLHL